MNTACSLLLSVALTSLTLTGTFGADIINGKRVKNSSMLYMASVQIDGQHRCGGFLINPSYVMTAAHCDESGDMTVILGNHTISPQQNLRRYTVEHKHKHPCYKDPENGSDIMLLKLSEKLKIGEGVKTIEIPNKIPKKPLKHKSTCQVAGWGKTKRQDVVNDLLVTDVLTINFKTCQKMLRKMKNPVPDNILCSRGSKTKSCASQGDSGGPLVCSGRAVGIVSMEACDSQNVSNIYTDISKYTAWIEEVIKGGD